MDADDQEQGSVQCSNSQEQAGKKVKKQVPQKTIDDFWNVFTTKFPGKVHTILPQNRYAKSKAAAEPKGTVYSQAALKSYDEARAECQAAVAKIAKECKRVNMRYRDPHFDIEFDLKKSKDDCLEGLVETQHPPFQPNSVKRVHDIFDDPQFYVDEASAGDVRQGNDGDCWFLSALCALSNKAGLIDRVCVARDELVGVYGFVFHRDGEWIFTIIDDKLYLNSSDYDESRDEKFAWDQVFNRQDAEEEYRKAYQTGSRSLYFAQCSNENETWLPLMEKAFAKAHGDFRAIYGGFTGEAIEDLTGGVTTELFTTDILDKDKFWNEELSKVNSEFLFGCATGCFDNWKGGGHLTDRKGVVPMHAYSIMEAREIAGERLLRVRNPWGKTEWQGAWSDGSEQWTPEWMERLNHRFGNDGIFWISYKDLLRKYQSFDRTRLFGPEWTVTHQWTSVDVPWSADYNETKFSITLSEKGPIVIVLSQLDSRYYLGLQGQYDFSLHFRLEKDGEDDYIVRSHGNYLMNRSVSTDLELDAGTYSVLMKITARRNPSDPTPENIVRDNVKFRQEKLLQIGMAYDLAHAKGRIYQTEADTKAQADVEAKATAAAKQKQREDFRAVKYKEWLINKKQKERNKRHKLREEEHHRKKAEARKAVEVVEAPTRVDEPPNDVETPIVADGEEGKPETKEQEDDAESDEKSDTIVVNSTTPMSPPETAGTTSQTGPEPSDEVSNKDITTQAKIDQFNKNLLANPNDNANAGTNYGQAAGSPPSENEAPLAEIASDTDSVLSFNSSIDSELDLATQAADESTQTVPQVGDLAPTQAEPEIMDDSDDENAEFANDPWNAVCVVGLRVFSKEGNVSVAIMRPKTTEDEESPLDLDDPSKGVSDDVAAAADGDEQEETVANGS